MHRQAGHAVVWILVAIAGLLALVFTKAVIFDPSHQPPWGVWLILGGALAVLIGGMYVESRHNAYQCSIVGLGLTLLAAGDFLFSYFGGLDPHLLLLIVGLAMAALAVAFAANLARLRYAKDTLPDILHREFPSAPIYEVDGVQFVSANMPGIVAPGETARFQLMLQNCGDHERTIEVEIKGPKGFTLDRPPEVRLPPAATGLLTIPVATKPNVRGKAVFYFTVAVSGERGTRVRQRYGIGVSKRTPSWLSAGLLFFGILHTGGGLRFEILIIGEPAAASDAPPAPPPVTWEIIWEPDPLVLRAAKERLS